MQLIRSALNKLTISAFAALFLLLASQSSLAQKPKLHPATKVASVEGISEYQLENGLRVLLFPDTSKQQVTVNVTYLVGSLHEGYGETGMAHLLEHLVFKGTPNHPDLPKELTERGAAPNGSTWFDRTNYFETLPATEDNLRWALAMEADRMINSFIRKEDLVSEMTVVRNEWESGENNPISVLMDRILATSYLWHNYGNTTIGARADIENVPIDRLKAFYKKYYQPDNAVLVVAGNFEEKIAKQMVEEIYGPIPKPDRTGANQLFPTYTAEPAQDGERTVTLRRVGDTQLIATAYHVPAGSDPEFASVDVLTHVLGNSPSGRLYKNLVETKLAANVGTFAFQLKQPALLIAYAEVRLDGSLDEAAEALFETLKEVQGEKPPTEVEVERAKTAYLTSMERAYRNPQGIALELSEWAGMGDWRLMFLHRDNLEKVTKETVLSAAESYLIESNRTIGRFEPTDETPPRAQISQPPDIAELVDGYVGREAVSQGEDFDPSPLNIQKRTATATLSNGLKLALLSKETRGDAVTLNLTFPFGTADSLMHQHHNAFMARSMLMRGTQRLSRQELRDELDRIKTQMNVYGENWSVGASVSTVREHLPEAINLLAEVLREPAFHEEEFTLLVQEVLASIEANMSEPQYLATEAYRRYLVNTASVGHPFYYYTAEEDIEALSELDVEDVVGFWQNFVSSENGAIAVVGDFDASEVQSQLDASFGNWTSDSAYEHIPYEHVVQDAVEYDIETPDKTNAIMYAALNLGIHQKHEDFPAFRIGMQVLGGGFLNSRLAVRIRQKDGLSYGVGAQLQTLEPDPTSLFLAYAIYAPQNRDRVVAAFREEVDRLLADGIPAEEFEGAIRGYLDFRQNLRANDANVASQLQANLRWGRTMEFTHKIEQAIEKLTSDDVVNALRSHLATDRIAIFRAGDFATNPPENES